jgi:peptidoglycan hydrolase-like protein with peptidoglycan-binding domain
MENRREDVRTIQRSLGALGLMPEDPFDDPRGFIDEPTDKALRSFQESNGLRVDGWAGPGGETERALRDGLIDLSRFSRSSWFDYTDRAARAQKAISKGRAASKQFGEGTTRPRVRTTS